MMFEQVKSVDWQRQLSWILGAAEGQGLFHGDNGARISRGELHGTTYCTACCRFGSSSSLFTPQVSNLCMVAPGVTLAQYGGRRAAETRTYLPRPRTCDPCELTLTIYRCHDNDIQLWAGFKNGQFRGTKLDANTWYLQEFQVPDNLPHLQRLAAAHRDPQSGRVLTSTSTQSLWPTSTHTNKYETSCKMHNWQTRYHARSASKQSISSVVMHVAFAFDSCMGIVIASHHYHETPQFNIFSHYSERESLVCAGTLLGVENSTPR